MAVKGAAPAAAGSAGEATPLFTRTARADPRPGPAEQEADVEAPAPATAPAAARAWRFLVAAAMAATYIAVSAAMILFNKTLMNAEYFPFPTCLTTMHMFGSVVLTSLLRAQAPSLFPSWLLIFGAAGKGPGEESPDRHLLQGPLWVAETLLPFAPVALCSMVSLIAGNWAYRYSDVSFLQTVKESQVVTMYIFSVLFGLERPQLRSMLVLTFVATAATFAISNGANPNMLGLLLQLLGGVAGALQMVLQNWLMSRSGRARIDPMTLVFCVASNMLVALAPANYIFWDPRIPSRVWRLMPALMASVLLAFSLQVTMVLTIRELGAVGMALASMVKDLMIVSSGAYLLHENLTRLQLCGFLGSVFGIGLYSWMKLPASPPGPPPKEEARAQ